MYSDEYFQLRKKSLVNLNFRFTMMIWKEVSSHLFVISLNYTRGFDRTACF